MKQKILFFMMLSALFMNCKNNHDDKKNMILLFLLPGPTEFTVINHSGIPTNIQLYQDDRCQDPVNGSLSTTIKDSETSSALKILSGIYRIGEPKTGYCSYKTTDFSKFVKTRVEVLISGYKISTY